MSLYDGRGIGLNRQLVTPLDIIRGSEFFSGVLSGAATYVSGFTIYSGIASNIVKGRLHNAHFFNNENATVTIVFRDGSLTGTIFAGPWQVNAGAERDIRPDMLRGMYFTSGVYIVVISGPAYSRGINYRVGWQQDPDPTNPGGLLE
jgi:hypothetical protein